MSKDFAIGVDIGGTNVRAALINRNGKIDVCKIERIASVKTPPQMVKLIEKLVEPFLKKKNIRIIGLGLGFPGIIDVRHGVVDRAPHYPKWREVSLREIFSRKFGLPIILDNDANMTAVGEMLWGAAKGMKNFVMVTLGTGIGGGIVIGGEIYHGPFGYAGEIGHIVIERGGLECDCGSHGCWEEYAAASFFKRRGLGGKLAEKLANEGDKNAKALWREYGKNLGIGINNLINVLGITNFIIGGGLARADKLFWNSMRKEIKERAYEQNYKRLTIKKSKLIDAAGVLGSAAAVFNKIH